MRRFPRVLVLLLLPLLAVPFGASARADTVYSGYPVVQKHLGLLPLGTSLAALGVTSPGINMSVLVRETDVDAWFDDVTVTVPAGMITAKVCIGVIPVKATMPTLCSSASSSGLLPTTLSLSSQTVEAIRPLDAASTIVQASLAVDQTLVSGSIVHLASTWTTAAASSVVIPPMGKPVSQARGSNVLLFRAGMTLADIAADLDVLKASGGTMVRTAFFWPALQPVPGPFDPQAVAKVDGFLQLARDRGLKVDAILGSTPCWSSTAPASLKGDCSNPFAGWATYPPGSLADVQAAATEVAKRWGSQLSGLEVWNEPNSTRFFTGTPADYAAILRSVYTAVKAVTPKLPVVAGDLAYADVAYLHRLYAAGIKGYFDAISIHPYNVRFDTVTGTGDPMTPWPTPASNKFSFGLGVPWIHWQMQAMGDGSKPIWITEFGFSDCAQASALCVTDAQQASYLASSFRLAARLPYVPVVLGYNVHDAESADSWSFRFGLTTFDRQAKPALASVQSTFACLAAATC